MRKLCVALLLFMLAFPLLGQVTLLDEDFEPTPDPLWNFYLDLGSAGWSHETAAATYYHSYNHVIRQLYGSSGVVTTSWAVYGPLMVPGDNPVISWWEYSSWPGDYGYHGVWASKRKGASVLRAVLHGFLAA